MGTNELRDREKWQDKSGYKADKAEHSFENVFRKCFVQTNFSICSNPKEFKNIYVEYPLAKKELDKIYKPPNKIKQHGFTPDFSIDHENGKSLYIEIKRQDGWVEGKPRSAGRGNAHERVCKYFTPGLLKIMRKQSGITKKNALPFWVIFQGDITRDPCRVREITCWFNKYHNHLFFWRDVTDPYSLINHFDSKLKHLFLSG